MKTIAMVLIAVVLVLPSLVNPAGASDPSGASSPHVEWSLDIPADVYNWNVNFTDLDGDGAMELMLNWGRNFTFFDTPSYEGLLALNDTSIRDMEFVRIGDSRSMDILVTYRTPFHFNISVISGRDFKESWRTPDINGSGGGAFIGDLDADGKPEMVVPALDWNSTYFHVFDPATRSLEWTSPRIVNERPFHAGSGRPTWVRNIDDDPALELLTSGETPDYGGNPITAFDGGTHEKQWTVSMPEPFYFLPYCDPLVDCDGDFAMELVLPYGFRGEPANATCGINIYSSKNGTLEWSLGPWDGYISLESMGDFDGDGWTDFPMEIRKLNLNGTWNYTYSIFSPSLKRSLWTLGPFLEAEDISFRLLARDLDFDGSPEAILSRTTRHGDRGSTVVFQVIRGPDVSVRWTSPETWMSGNHLRMYIPGNGSEPRILLAGSYHSETGNISSTLLVLSSSDFRELLNRSFAGNLDLFDGDWNGEPGNELLLGYSGVELLNGTTLESIWNASWTRSHIWDIDTADITGGTRYELIQLSHFTEMRSYNGTGVRSWDTTTMTMWDSQTLDVLWTSQRLDGTYFIQHLGDIDNDTNIEALFRVTAPNMYTHKLVIIEFPRGSAADGKPWTPGLSLRPPAVFIEKPRAGDRVSGKVRISGTAEDDTFISLVIFRIDDGKWANATWTPADGNRSCSWTANWDASKAWNGTHAIWARAFDGTGWSPDAMTYVEVQPAGTVKPDWPGTTIANAPDPACIVLLVVLVAAIAGYLLHRRGK
jgi:hypothetical protein